MNVQQFLAASGLRLSVLQRGAGVCYGHLHAHCRYGTPLGQAVARKLEAWTRAEFEAGRVKHWISAADVLGFKTEPPIAPGAPEEQSPKAA